MSELSHGVLVGGWKISGHYLDTVDALFFFIQCDPSLIHFFSLLEREPNHALSMCHIWEVLNSDDNDNNNWYLFGLSMCQDLF